jgi:hypothetical protein
MAEGCHQIFLRNNYIENHAEQIRRHAASICQVQEKWPIMFCFQKLHGLSVYKSAE